MLRRAGRDGFYPDLHLRPRRRGPGAGALQKTLKARNGEDFARNGKENQTAFYLPRQDFLFRMKSLKSS